MNNTVPAIQQCSANPAHLPQKRAKWAELAMDAEIHCNLSALKSWHNNLYLSGVLPRRFKTRSQFSSMYLEGKER